MGKQNYSLKMPCTLIGNAGPMCPSGWVSVGYTPPGSCLIGNPPGNGHTDQWQMNGYHRVCKKAIDSTGDLAVDCCSNVSGIADSVECRTNGYIPYSDKCNNVMTKKCNNNVIRSPYGPQWDGMPNGQELTRYDSCLGTVRIPTSQPSVGCLDNACVYYLQNAPAGNFFRNHDYIEYPHHFPRHSYTTSNLAGNWGYYPMRMPYQPWNDYNHKNLNTFN